MASSSWRCISKKLDRWVLLWSDRTRSAHKFYHVSGLQSHQPVHTLASSLINPFSHFPKPTKVPHCQMPQVQTQMLGLWDPPRDSLLPPLFKGVHPPCHLDFFHWLHVSPRASGPKGNRKNPGPNCKWFSIPTLYHLPIGGPRTTELQFPHL